MITHRGYIFSLANSSEQYYLGMIGNVYWLYTNILDARLFADQILPNGDWSDIVDKFQNVFREGTNIKDFLVAIPATQYHDMKIGHYDEQ